MDPVDPASAQTTASFYWEKAYKDSSLLPSDRYQYVLNGIAATDRAIAIKPDFADALTYKNLLLRMRANLETAPVLQQQLIREADSLRNRAIELNKQRSTTAGSATPYHVLPELPPPPPPPPPPAPGSEMAPVRVGGNVKVPTKLKDVRPDYPSDAMAARIEGVVIIEAVISTDGRVSNARVLRSIPQLDDAAVAAVRQWEFTQTLLNGVPVPVIMTVTVNFTLQ
jgi:TonB family protein